MDEDPITQFFPGEDSVDLYAVLSVKSDSSADDIKRSYRRLALICHPDKHTNASEKVRADALFKFQQVGFAYAVLSDDKRRRRYDNTGKTDEGIELAAGEDGWEAYFEAMFDRVTKGKLDEMKNEYQGSAEETQDLKNAYVETGGSIGDIMTFIPHSTDEDEPRFILHISQLIAAGDLPSLPHWEPSTKDEKSRIVRKKQNAKEAKEAEELARELGVWDEFYGSGKASERNKKGKGAGKGKAKGGEEGEDHSALQALILKKRKNLDGFYDNLAARYSDPELTTRSKKKKKRAKVDTDEEEESPKKSKRSAQPDIDEEEFQKLQQKLFGDNGKASSSAGASKTKRATRGKRAK